MDPTAVWTCLCEALKDLEKWPNNTETRAHVVDCLHVLSRWIYSGGFPPDVLKVSAQMVAHEVLNNPLFKESK